MEMTGTPCYKTIACISSAAFVLTAAAFAVLLVKYRKNALKTKTVQHQIEIITKDKQKYFELVNTLINRRAKIIARLAMQSEGINYQKEWEMLKEKTIGDKEMAFDSTVDILEELHHGFMNHLKQKFPELKDKELRVALLSCCDLSNSEIASILGVNVFTVNKTRQNIREKLGMDKKGFKQQIRNILSP